MTEKIRRVDLDGPPDPDEHPWVMMRAASDPNSTVTARWALWRSARTTDWPGNREWYPVPEPPSEYLSADSPEWTVRDYNGAPVVERDGHALNDGLVLSFDEAQSIADTLNGLVPAVPQSLVEWLRVRTRNNVWPDYADAYLDLLGCIEAGEFGPVEPSGPSVEWVTDRLPRDDEPGPFLCSYQNEFYVAKHRTNVGSRSAWVSVPALLDAAGLR